MSEREKQNIDEVISEYLDGELGERQSQELHRLMQHDPELATRVAGLEKCKLLVGAMPRMRAPESMFENIKTSMERRVLLQDCDNKNSPTAGHIHLFGRRLAAAAAMLLLVAVLAGVIISIVKPNGTRQKVVMNTDWSKAQTVVKHTPAAEKPKPVIAAVAEPKKEASLPMQMQLELKTDQYIAVTSYIYRSVIVDNGLLEATTINRQPDSSTYTIVCGRGKMNNVLNELQTVWGKFKETAFSIGSDRSQWAASVENPSAEQVIQIMTQRHPTDQVKLANDFASLNKLAAQQPGKEVATAVEQTTPVIIKPVEASADKPQVKENPAVEKITLTITVHELN